MKFKSTWILLIILALIASYFFFIEERSRKQKEIEKEESGKILPYSPEDVEKLIFHNPEGDTIEMEKVGSEWKIKSPVITKGSASTINALVKQIVPGYKKEVLKGVSNLEDYGLKEPFASIVIFAKDRSKPDTILVGDKTPTSSSCYMRLGHSRDVIISTEMTRNLMNKNLYHLRDKNFLNIDSNDIDAIKIKSGKMVLKLVKKDKNWWIEDANYRADKYKVVTYLNKLTRAIIKEFVREDKEVLGPYGLEKPKRMITLQHGSEIIDIFFGNKKNNKVYTVRSGLDKVLLLDDTMLDAFEWNRKNLRAMNLAFFDIDKVKHIHYETPDTTCDFTRLSSIKWKVSDNDSLEIKSYEVNSMLRKLTSLKFEKIITEPLPEFDKRLEDIYFSITLTDENNNILDKITIAKAKGDFQYGASLSANVIGNLKKDTDLQVTMIFKRIGE